MAAYGGLAMDNEEYELAARIWMTLQDTNYWTPSTATARLGFPLSLERMAASDQGASTQAALSQYQAAERSFTNRLTKLTSLPTRADDPAWVHDLLQVFANPDRDELQSQTLMQQWQEQLGHTDWLEWLATDQVHQALVQWRELNGMEDYLAGLPEKVAALEAVAGEQRRRSEQAKALLVNDGLLDQRDALAGRIESTHAHIQRIEAAVPMPDHAWMYVLADAQERDVLDQLAHMQAQAQYLAASDKVKWLERIARLEGVLFYRIVDQRAKRIQALRLVNQQMRSALVDLDARIARVQEAEENFSAGVETDFYVFIERSNDIVAQVREARQGREELLAGEIRARMQQEVQQLQQYLLVTRIAIARATDVLALNTIEQGEAQ